MLPPLEDFLSGKIKTLGWQVLDWTAQWLVNPDTKPGIHAKGDRWIFRPDQTWFVLAFYAVDSKGEWLFRRAYRERSKGSGKSPLVAAIACAEFLGPTLFSHFDAFGNPVGIENPDAIIWVTGISKDSCKHTYKYIMGMLDGEAEAHFDLDIGKSRILQRGNADNKIIEILTASASSHEGPQPTFAVLEETQYWTPAAVGLFEDVIQRGLMKTNGRRIEVTNAPEPGLGSVAEDTHKYQEMIELGEVEEAGLLFDTFSVHIKDLNNKEEFMAGLELMYEHAPWINRERTWRDSQDPSMRPLDVRRFLFNEILPPYEMWIPGTDWDKAKTRVQLNKRDKISLGFRIRKYCCAITATRLRDSATFLLKLWERPQDGGRDWEVPYAEIDQFMRKTMAQMNVVYVMTSPNGFADVIGRWQMDFEDEVTFEALWLDRNKQKHADAVEVFEAAVRDRRLKHTGDPELRRHIMNCFVTEAPQGRLIRMETLHSKRFIVAAEAAVLSFYGAIEAIEDGLLQDAPDNYAFSF